MSFSAALQHCNDGVGVDRTVHQQFAVDERDATQLNWKIVTDISTHSK